MKNDRQTRQKVLVIVGPTTSGKSSLAVLLAKKYNGEVISADSRQVYTGLNIGTGKITKREMAGVRHHLLDVANPKNTFTVVQYKKLAEKSISDIAKHGKLPIIAGGSGFYVDVIIEGFTLPEVVPNKKLRKELEKKSTEELVLQLESLDPGRAKMIDKNNSRRLVRGIEIALSLGTVPKLEKDEKYNALCIGIKIDREKLKKKISSRLSMRMKKGMIAEARKLHSKGLSWKRMHELGLEYRSLALYLQKKLTKEEMVSKLETEILQYAKRQMTWFKRNERILWFSIKETGKIKGRVERFLAEL